MTEYAYGEGSTCELLTVRGGLQRVCQRALGYGIMDASVIQGVRNKTEQNEYFVNGKSKVQWPNSKHNVIGPANRACAVDVAPYINGKISWRKDHCCMWAGLMLAAAKDEGIKLRWGGNWDMDGEPITDQDFQDLVHFEMVN